MGKSQIMQGFVGHMKFGLYPKSKKEGTEDFKQEVISQNL